MTDATMTAVDLIAAERQRQLEAEGWTAEHDDGHMTGELAWAAVCYAAPGRVYVGQGMLNGKAFGDPWPWRPHSDMSGRGSYDWDKRKKGPQGHVGNAVRDMPADGPERIDFLVKAGALIAAEIDRLNRLASREGRQDG